jgi:hypothetical protein
LNDHDKLLISSIQETLSKDLCGIYHLVLWPREIQNNQMKKEVFPEINQSSPLSSKDRTLMIFLL